MNCNEFKANIDSFIDGELNDKETADFKIHFASCKNCHMELESVNKCSKVLRNLLKPETPPQSIQEKVFRELNVEK